MTKKKGKIIILSSPSGGGKTTIANILITKYSNMVSSVSMTTRLKGSNEINKVDYFFTTYEMFQKHIQDNRFLEYALIHEHYYGTPKEFVYKSLDNGQDVVLDVDWQGQRSIRQQVTQYNITSFFIMPPSLQTLKERLIKRNRETMINIEKRMKQAENEILYKNECDFIIVNDYLENSIRQIEERLGIKTIDTTK